MVQIYKNGALFMVIPFLLGLVSCGHMVKTTRIENGREVTVYTSQAGLEKMKKEDEAKAKQIEAYRQAKKRQPTDPIIVALYEAEVPVELAKATDKEKLNREIRKHFQKDSVIQLVGRKKLESALSWQMKATRDKLPYKNADVSVFPAVTAKEKYGVNRRTGKLGSAPVLIFKADVISHYYPEDRYESEKMGHIFHNAKVAKQFAADIKRIIKNKIGPNIPAKENDWSKTSSKRKRKAPRSRLSKWLNRISVKGK